MTIVADHRKSSAQGGGGEALSRERFKERYKGQIRKAVEKAIKGGNVTDIGKGGIDVSVPKEDLHEPSIHHGQGGMTERVFPGNKQYNAGDKIDKPQGGGGQGGNGNEASENGNGNDEFTFAISEEEFLNVLFEGLGLPNMTKHSAADIKQTKPKLAGFVSTGPQNRLHLPRSFQKKKARVNAAAKSSNDQIIELLEEEKSILAEYAARKKTDDDHPATSQRLIPTKVQIKTLAAAVADLKNRLESPLSATAAFRIAAIEDEIEGLQKKKGLIPSWNESTDLIYRNQMQQPLPAAKAVMFCLMDVSGSMDEEKKAHAKIFYFLLYRFLKRHYEHTEVVFIRHHTEAEEVTEKQFFYDQATGGTIVSTALEKMLEITQARYAGAEWNIYGAQASDGDNFDSDNAKCDQLMRKILQQTQGYFYTEIEKHGYRQGGLWHTYKRLENEFQDGFWMGQIKERGDIWPLFRKFFEKRETIAHLSKPSVSAFDPN